MEYQAIRYDLQETFQCKDDQENILQALLTGTKNKHTLGPHAARPDGDYRAQKATAHIYKNYSNRQLHNCKSALPLI